MARFAYHASHEQFPPSKLLAWAQAAEQAGFDSFFSSDHFHPWSEAQGESGFSWAWVGAALAKTALSGGMICCPGYRYHPAVVAQAAATLLEMFPERFWLAIGSGEKLNERITGLPWPAKPERHVILQESAEIMRALWAGETVTHDGLVKVKEAKLYTRPQKTPQLIGAAITEATAEWLGGWADGLLTVSHRPAELRRVVEAFYRGGGEGKPLYLKIGLAYGASDDRARVEAHAQWRSVAFSSDVLVERRTPAECEKAGEAVRVEDMDRSLRISSSLQQHVDWLSADLELGFDELILHNINGNQEEFIEDFAAGVLPHLGIRRGVDV